MLSPGMLCSGKLWLEQGSSCRGAVHPQDMHVCCMLTAWLQSPRASGNHELLSKT